jgi:hypothetical protein
MSILLREELVRRPISFNLIVYIYLSLPFKKLQLSMGTLNIELTPNNELASYLFSVAKGNERAEAELLFPPTTGEDASVLFLLFEIM